MELLQQAVDRDKGNAHAWSRARAAANNAITLDPNLAEAHAALADVKLYGDWDWAGAEREFLRTNELNPNLAFNTITTPGIWSSSIALTKRSPNTSGPRSWIRSHRSTRRTSARCTGGKVDTRMRWRKRGRRSRSAPTGRPGGSCSPR
jgi:hypothetical protein